MRRALVQLEETLNKEMKQAGQDFSVCCDTILETETVNKPAETVTSLESLPEAIKLALRGSRSLAIDALAANPLVDRRELAERLVLEYQAAHAPWLDHLS